MIRVILSSGKAVELAGAPAALVEFVCEEREYLAAARFGTLTVDWNEGDIKPQSVRRWGAIAWGPPGETRAIRPEK